MSTHDEREGPCQCTLCRIIWMKKTAAELRERGDPTRAKLAEAEANRITERLTRGRSRLPRSMR